MDLYGELAEESRRTLLAQLRSGPKTVNELVESTGMKQPNVSNHLSRMRRRGVVRDERNGRNVYYSIASPLLVELLDSRQNLFERSSIGADLEFLAQKLATHAVRGEEAEARYTLNRAIAGCDDLVSLYEDFIVRGMSLVGDWWASGNLCVAQEHVATNVVTRLLDRISSISAPSKKVAATALLGCAEGSHHVLGLRMLSDFLQSQGWTSIFLGADVPAPAFIEGIEEFKPDLVLVSCTTADALDSTVDLVRALHEASKVAHFQLGVGGVEVLRNQALFEENGVDFVAGSLRQFAETILPGLESDILKPA